MMHKAQLRKEHAGLAAQPGEAPASREDLPAWLARMSPHGRAVLTDVVRRYVPELEEMFVVSPPRRATTRQARHAKQTRARSTLACAAVMHALVDEHARRLVLSAEFALLRPYTADAQSKWLYLLPRAGSVSRAACESLFEAASALFLSLGSRVSALPTFEALRILNAVSAMAVGPLLFGPAFAQALADLAREAARRGLCDNPCLRARVAYLRSWAGDDADQIELLLDPALARPGLGEGYLFVRSDTREEVYEASAELLRTGTIDADRCLLRSNPRTTISQLLDFTLTRLRDTAQLRTPGYALLLLLAAHRAREHAHELHARGLLPHGLAAIQQRLARFERVQLMEKRRYYELFDAMPEGPAKRRLAELWHASLAPVA